MAQTAQQLSPELIEVCKSLGTELNVTSEIHDSDFIFRFINRGSDTVSSVRRYFSSGATIAAWLKALIGEVRPLDKPFSMLDFASGYGRVARHLPGTFPHARVVASDIHSEAVNFLNRNGIKAFQSTSIPENFLPEQHFDVVVAISFFTHMPRRTWTPWLRALLGCLTPRGLLIFTTHGESGLKVMSSSLNRELPFDKDGFWFAAIGEQEDLKVTEYGSTATSFRFVFEQVSDSGAKLLRFQEAGLGYQDLYIVQNVLPSPVYVGSINDKLYAASVQPKGTTLIGDSKPLAKIEVLLTNTGRSAWVTAPDEENFYFGGRLYHSTDVNYNKRPAREYRARLPNTVEPGGSAAVSLVLDTTGLPPSKYRLHLDMVKEGLFWFEDRGGTCAVLELELHPDLSLTFTSLPMDNTYGPDS